MGNSKFDKLLDYSLLTFIILWSGGCVTYGMWNDWPLHMLPMLVILFAYRKCKFDISSFIPMIVISLIVFAQMIAYNGAPISAYRVALITLDMSLATLILKDNFVCYYTRIIYFFAVTSLALYLFDIFGGHSTLLSISQFFPQGGREIMSEFDFSQEASRTLWIYQVRDAGGFDYIRNSGPFWEAGRLTIYLNIALFLCLFHYKYKLTSREVILLVVCNLTTVSTTGYIAMILILMFYSFKGNMSNQAKIVSTICVTIFLYFILQADFMTDKIGGEMASDETYSRFGAMAYHFTQIVQAPILGFGPYLSHVFNFDLAISPNGITDSLRYFGIPCTLYLWYLLYKGSYLYLNKMSKSAHFVYLFVVLLLAFTQTITNSPFYYLLYFMGALRRNTSSYEKS